MARRMSCLVPALALLLAVPLLGCGGGGATNTVHNTTVSKGQQLLDLKQALDAGAISRSEYDKERSRILEAP